ncbi:nuclear transport factor 2 family protein [Diaminobutyricibacter tongyongensis]|uniref:Nuclear transport factor 2 family protein n=1 Tax=Leifsonia tongyongensis TaxID=1268043 RepID=A0A6L9XUG0_9MICO|nr:nuclear transport factor 2 family protein [Diaminobutyricibacter tongyongensis]NEN04917.1 nuclear transport factor 2 family protein [Diaminobutyricibacter tongyongensis]
MDEVERRVVDHFRDAMAAGDAEAVRLALHPYLHWTEPSGSVVRGRVNVLAALSTGGVPALPGSVELRDGQIYRWVCESVGEEEPLAE